MENLNEWLVANLDTASILVVSVLLIFVGLIILTRISGLRTFAKMTSFDFASTIAIGSILATVSIDPKTSVSHGMIVLVTIIGFQALFAAWQRFSKKFRKIATNKPVILMRDGVIFQDQLNKCNLHKSELVAKLREANVIQFSEVKAVVFESTGDISVLHTSGDEPLDSRLLDFLDS